MGKISPPAKPPSPSYLVNKYLPPVVKLCRIHELKLADLKRILSNYLNLTAKVSNMLFSDVSIERVGVYWNRRPCNIRHSAKPIGSKDYFDEVEARKYRVESHIPALADFE